MTLCFRHVVGVLAISLITLATPNGWAETGDEKIGRLFFTPQQRELLDARRSTIQAEDSASGQSGEKVLQVEGLVQNAKGMGTFWVNGEEFPTSPASKNQSGAVGLPGHLGKRLKVGETFDPDTGEKRDVVPQDQLVAPRNKK